MENIGKRLKEQRLEKGYTFQEIEKETKIRRRYLEALENEEWDIFPGIIYLKGFIKTYCRYLDLDEEEILQGLAHVINDFPEQEPLPQKIEIPGRPRRMLGIILGIVAVILLIASQQIFESIFQRPPVEVKNPPGQSTDNTNNNPATSTTNGEEKEEIQTPPVEVIESISVRIQSIEYRCWVEIKDGKNRIYEGTITKGQEISFTDLKDVTFSLGNSGDVRVFINEQDLGVLGKKGEVVSKRFVLENNEIKEITP